MGTLICSPQHTLVLVGIQILIRILMKARLVNSVIILLLITHNLHILHGLDRELISINNITSYSLSFLHLISLVFIHSLV